MHLALDEPPAAVALDIVAPVDGSSCTSFPAAAAMLDNEGDGASLKSPRPPWFPVTFTCS